MKALSLILVASLLSVSAQAKMISCDAFEARDRLSALVDESGTINAIGASVKKELLKLIDTHNEAYRSFTDAFTIESNIKTASCLRTLIIQANKDAPESQEELAKASDNKQLVELSLRIIGRNLPVVDSVANHGVNRSAAYKLIQENQASIALVINSF